MKKYEVTLNGGTKVEVEGRSPSFAGDWVTFDGEGGDVLAAFRKDLLKVVVEKGKVEVDLSGRPSRVTTASIG